MAPANPLTWLWRRWARSAVIATALVALTGLVSGCGISFETMPLLGSSTGAGYDIHATFDNVLNLAQGAQVRDGDALVGRVTSLSTNDYLAHVTLHIQRSVRLPVGTTATVQFNTPLGDEYVQLEPPAHPTAAVMRAGATIVPPDAVNAPSVEDLLAALAAVLYGGGLSQAHTVVDELNQIIGPNQPQLRRILTDLNTTVGSLSANASNLDNALAAIAKVSAELNAGSGDIVRALNTLPAAADTLHQNNALLETLLKSLNNLSPVAIGVVQQSGQNLVSDAQELIPVVQQLVASEAELRPALTNGTSLITNIARDIPNGYAQIFSNLLAVFPPGTSTQLPPGLIDPQTLTQKITSGQALQTLIDGVLP